MEMTVYDGDGQFLTGSFMDYALPRASDSLPLRIPAGRTNRAIGLTEMMVTNAARFGTEKALEPLRRVNAAGTHLLSLINEVLRSRQARTQSRAC